MKVLAKEAAVRLDNGQWRVLRAVLVTSLGGRKVIYTDKDGFEVYSEALCKSQFKNIPLNEDE